MKEYRVTIVTHTEGESMEEVMEEIKGQLHPDMNSEITVDEE